MTLGLPDPRCAPQRPAPQAPQCCWQAAQTQPHDRRQPAAGQSQIRPENQLRR